MKPGQMSNIEHPEVSAATGLSDSTRTSLGSRQTADTAQLSSNPNRMAPYRGPAGPSGEAEIERDDLVPGHSDIFDTRATYKVRKRIFPDSK